MNIKILLTGLTLALVPIAAAAHGPKTGPLGGPQADAGNYHVELVPKGTALEVHLRDQSDKPVSTQGFRGTAIFVSGGKTERIPLTPEGDNRLKGTATVSIPAEPKGAVQIVPPQGATVQAKFD